MNNSFSGLYLKISRNRKVESYGVLMLLLLFSFMINSFQGGYTILYAY